MTSRLVVTPLHYDPPLEFFERLQGFPAPILLESVSTSGESSRYSFIMADPIERLTAGADEWPLIRERIRATMHASDPRRTDLPPFQGGWAGWFGYELGAAFDPMPRAARDDLKLPDLALGLYDWVIACDHQKQKAMLISTGFNLAGERDQHRARNRSMLVMAELAIATPAKLTLGSTPLHSGSHEVTAFATAPVGLTGDFSPEEYRVAAGRVIEHILEGDIFQANLTQRFLAPFATSPVELYQALRERTRAPMSAVLQQEDLWILSVSPERFMRLDAETKHVNTSPIKGTRPRGATPAEDTRLQSDLLTSEKDRAENVMIVDLLRNDLARVCQPGSVAVPELCTLESHQAVHHLVSTVTGVLRGECDALDLLAATFPGGSITGAPKIRAMEIISALEPVTRGPYCGCIGWIGFDGSMDLNIAIRTVTCRDGVAILNAGGGLTARSDPEAEYQETLDKARALVAAIADVQ